MLMREREKISFEEEKKKQEQFSLLPLHYDLETVSVWQLFSCLWI